MAAPAAALAETPPPKPDRAAILAALEALFDPDDVIELRALHKTRKRTDAGYFDAEHRDALADAAVRLNAAGAAVYINLNKLDPQLLGRYCNRVEEYAQATATDANVTRRRWLLVDLDPVRPKDTAATDAQLKAANEAAREVAVWLAEQGWPAPLKAESGNGAHLLYPLDLANDGESRELVKGALSGLAQRFDTDAVKLDQSVFNAGRIVKLYGTVAIKGDHTPAAPWRLSRLLAVPERGAVVTPDQLRALSQKPAPAARPGQNGSGANDRSFDLHELLDRLGIGYVQDLHEGTERYRLEHCPFNPDHGCGEAAIFRGPDGRLGFKCQHNSCADRHWHDVRELVDGPRDRRAAPGGGSDAQTYARLAKLTPAEYDRVREAEAKALGIRSATLDAGVRRLRSGTDEPRAGEAMDFEEPEPWPDPVDGAVLLDELTANARRYLVLPVGAAEAIALWTVHSHAHAPAEVSPLLAITSPTPECGKTTALTLLGSLVARPLPASNVTAAALFRAVERWHPTLLVDEADTFLRDSDDLRGIINSGHHRAGAYVVRTVGEDHEPRKFSTWAPKAVAMIGKLHPTLASRAVHVELRRKAAGEHVEPLRLDRLEHLVPLKRRAARWAADHMQALRRADPVMPDGLYGRAADNWRALLGIADAAGSEWPQRAREAARALTAGRAEETAGVLLLGDLRALFAQRKTEHLASAEIVSALAGMEDRPWPEWQRGQPITARQLARLLEPFGIRPGTRRDRTETFKGYTRAAFDDAFGRYLGISSVTPSQVSTGAGFRDFVPVTAADNVTDEEPLKPSTGAGCNGVTDRKPVAWGADV